MKTCFWDLESSHLKGNFAVLLSGAVKGYGVDPIVFVNKNLPSSDDRVLLKEIRDELEKYDILVSYYGLRFDLLMLNTRLMGFHMTPLSRKFHIDLYFVVKRTFNTHSRRLQAITEHLGIEGKDGVKPELWKKAQLDGDRRALAEIADHNRRDVVVLEELYDMIKWNIHGINKKP